MFSLIRSAVPAIASTQVVFSRLQNALEVATIRWIIITTAVYDKLNLWNHLISSLYERPTHLREIFPKKLSWIVSTYTSLVSKVLLSSIEDTFKPYVHSGTSIPIYYYSHSYVPRNLKRISSQGCFMMLIGCRTDGYLKARGWIFPILLVIKKGNLWRFLWRICNQTTINLRSTLYTPDNDDTYDSDTDTTLPPYSAVSSSSVIRISWFDNGHIPADIVICWFPGWFLNREARRQRRVSIDAHWLVKQVST